MKVTFGMARIVEHVVESGAGPGIRYTDVDASVRRPLGSSLPVHNRAL